MSECPDCGTPIEPSDVHCRNSHFLGYPNYREAESERDALSRRYDEARTDCAQRDVEALLAKLEDLAARSRPVIAMPIDACDGMLRSKKYRNYHQRLAAGERGPALPSHHADREMVGARLFPVYHHHIVYAALSPDGGGMPTYGKVMAVWDVTPDYLGQRSSLLEENSFRFFNRHGLGRLGATAPAGYRSTWDDRTKLVAAKLGHRLNAATGENELAELLLQTGENRDEDDFVEIMIYADGGLDTLDVTRVVVQIAAATPEQHNRLGIVRDTCRASGIKFI